jgi:hypothetical protein
MLNSDDVHKLGLLAAMTTATYGLTGKHYLRALAGITLSSTSKAYTLEFRDLFLCVAAALGATGAWSEHCIDFTPGHAPAFWLSSTLPSATTFVPSSAAGIPATESSGRLRR